METMQNSAKREKKISNNFFRNLSLTSQLCAHRNCHNREQECIKLHYSRTDSKQTEGGTFSLSKCIGCAVPLYGAVKLLSFRKRLKDLIKNKNLIES